MIDRYSSETQIHCTQCFALILQGSEEIDHARHLDISACATWIIYIYIYVRIYRCMEIDRTRSRKGEGCSNGLKIQEVDGNAR